MATGSYEGYLLMEGIPDHHEASSFTRDAQRVVLALFRILRPVPSRPKLESTATCSSREGERGAR
jgi:hypothetical protein